MYEIIIFAIVLYLFITNSFIRVQLQDEGLFVIIKRREYIYDVSSGNYREEVVIKIKELYRFNNNNLPF